MNDEEITGQWWVPASPEHKVGGTLSARAGRAPELTLQEPLSDKRWESPIVLWGLSDQAEPITADVQFELGRSQRWRAPGHRVIQQHVVLQTAIVGAHLEDPPRSFRKITVEFSDLVVWSGWALLNEDWGPDGPTLTYVHPEPFMADVDGMTVSLEASFGTSGDAVSSRTFEVGAGFVLEHAQGWDIEEWLKRGITPLQSLVSVLADRPVAIEDLRVEWEDAFARVSYAPVDVEVPTDPARPFELPFTAESIRDRFAEVVARWLQLDAELGPALDLYLSTQTRRSAHLENRFLNMAGAVEAYHRRTVTPSPGDRERHEERVQRISSAIDSPKDRGWLEWKLKYAFEPTFADRLEEIADRAGPVLRFWIGDSHDFAQRVSQARNVLVHRDPSSPTPEPDGRSIVDMLEDLAILLLVCFYQDLGFEDKEIDVRLRRGRRWRYLEFRKREWK